VTVRGALRCALAVILWHGGLLAVWLRRPRAGNRQATVSAAAKGQDPGTRTLLVQDDERAGTHQLSVLAKCLKNERAQVVRQCVLRSDLNHAGASGTRDRENRARSRDRE
jgi:hypothetical protein